MAMKMLQAGGLDVLTDDVRQADEDNPEGYFELERVKELASFNDASWLHEARGKVIKIISYLLQHLPDDLKYRVVFMNRDLGEVLASQSRMLQRRGEKVTTPPEEMLQLYVDHLVKIRTILRLRPCFEVLEVPYDATVQDPMQTATRMRLFIGRPLDTDRMARAVNPQLYRNRRVGRPAR